MQALASSALKKKKKKNALLSNIYFYLKLLKMFTGVTKKITEELLYRNDPKFSDRYAWANSVDPDQTAPTGAV